MLKAFLATMLLLVLCACASPGLKPRPEATARLKQVYIVPMESPPLRVSSRISTTYVPSARGSDPSLQVLSAVTVMMMLLEVPEATARSARTSGLIQTALDVPAPWAPTRELAKEAEAQLVASGLKADVASSVEPIPGVEDRSYTFTMENWLGPIRSWYEHPYAGADYRSYARDNAALVMQVALSSYRMGINDLLLEVHLKLIDPATGEAIGRASATNSSDRAFVGTADRSFAKLAVRFKEAFAGEGKRLLKECLVRLGLAKE